MTEGKTIVTLTLGGLVALVGAAVGLWWLMVTHVGPDAARLWALVATAGLPLALALGYRLGHTEARGHVAGLEQGVGQVMKAAQGTAALRVSVARAMRAAPPVAPAPALDPGQVVIIPAAGPGRDRAGALAGDDVLLLE